MICEFCSNLSHKPELTLVRSTRILIVFIRKFFVIFLVGDLILEIFDYLNINIITKID
jgi:hypothetical protein